MTVRRSATPWSTASISRRSAAQALLQFGHLAYGVGKAEVGRAFTSLGFRHKRTATGRGYYVVQRTTDEIESRKRLLALDNDSDG